MRLTGPPKYPIVHLDIACGTGQSDFEKKINLKFLNFYRPCRQRRERRTRISNMANKLQLSQIYIPNSKQATNFVSLYEETVRHDQPVSLFLALEIRGDRKAPSTAKREEYEKITSAIARILKHTYLTETKLAEVTFEKALSNINNELSQLASKGVTTWYKRLNALVAAYSRSTLFVSVTGSTSAFLLRGKEFTQISENLSPGEKTHPLKTFASFASGALAENDHVIFSTSGLYNYVSLEKIKKAIEHQTLEEASREIIESLKQDAPSEAFAAFVSKVSSRLALPDAEFHPLMVPASHTIIEDKDTFTQSRLDRAWDIARRFFRRAGTALDAAYRTLLSTRRPPKQPTAPQAPLDALHAAPPSKLSFLRLHRRFLLPAAAVLAIALVSTAMYTNYRNKESRLRASARTAIDQAAKSLSDAEAALIYDDRARAIASFSQAKDSLNAASGSGYFSEEAQTLQGKMDKLASQMDKTVTISGIARIASFASTPNYIIRTANSFIGFNYFTDSFETVSATGTAKLLSFSSPMPENLVAGFWTGTAPVFLSTRGNFYALDAAVPALKIASKVGTNQPEHSYMGARIFGGRAYTMDTSASQIARFEIRNQEFGLSQPWLKSVTDLSDARDFAIDGSIWVLKGSEVARYTRGEQQNFPMPTLTTPLKNAQKIWTDQNSLNVYVADPDNSRIIVLSKQGGLVAQHVSPALAELKDFLVDEKTKTVYILSGTELSQYAY